MALINTSVPNLIQGVSQQPDATRFDGQCEEQENALSSVAEGLKKRPNTRHIARLMTSAIDSNSFVHFINRSTSEKYVLIHDGSKLHAYNTISGVEATINGSTGGFTVSGSYLDVVNPRTILNALTISDTTLILNSKKTVLPSTTKTAGIVKQALVTIIQGDYEKDYSVTVNVTAAAPVSASSVTDYVAPTFTINTEEYIYDSHSEGDEYYELILNYYKHRVSSVTIVDGGTNVPDDFEIQLASNYTIHAAPTFSLTVVGGVVTGVTVVSGGDFDGDPTEQIIAGSGSNATIGYNESNIGIIAPNISVTNGGSNVDTIVETLTAITTSNDATNSGSANTDKIAEKLRVQMVTGSTESDKFTDHFTVTRNGNSILLTLTYTGEAGDDPDTVYDFNITSTDSLGDSGMTAVYKSTSSITDLPLINQNGFKVRIVGDAELAQDDYYAQFETSDGSNFGKGAYVETVGNDIVRGIDTSTMPHVLVNFGVNAFDFKEASYLDRIAGDDESNPLPSFLNQTISGMFFFKNRLGFMSGDNVVMTESGFGTSSTAGSVTFNLGRTTVASLLDSDPIDISVSSSRVTSLKAAKGFQENLILFSDNGQFVLKGGDILTPKTVSVTPVTNFSFEDQVDPLPLGSYIYFPFTRGNFTGMREFAVNSTSDTYDAVEVTEHVPAYVPKEIVDMAGTTSEDMIALLSANEKGSLYIYNYFWNNNQKVLSAWSKFTFTGEIRGVEFIKSTLYAVIVNNGETNLVEMPLESGLKDDAGYVTHLDMRVASTVLSGASTITLPYTPEDDSVEVYTTDGLALSCSNVGSVVTLSNPVSADTDVWVGIPYTMKYTFSEQLFKAQAGNGKSPSNAAKMMIRNGSVYYNKSAYFKVKVTPKFRDTYENVFTPDVVGSSTIGNLSLDSGFYRFPVFTKPQDTTITIENDSALPSTFQSAEFESFVHSRSNRYG